MIKKRDGSTQVFDPSKIIDAVILSGASEEAADYIAEYVKQALIPEMTVFEIESLVEDLLLESDTKAAHEYISYRAKRAAERQLETPLFKSVLSVLAQNNPEITKENANIDGKTLAASRHILAGEMSKALAEQTLPIEVLDAHNSGAIHFHDMNFWGNSWTNCCLVDLKNMLKGFTLGGASIETPKSINTAASVIGQILANVSSNQYGGTSLPNIDVILEPYGFVSYEKHLRTAKAYGIALPETYARDLTIMEIGAACQALEYECNSAHNNAAQSPFTTISFGTTTSWVGREIQKAILNTRIKGLGKDGITAIFPKLIFFYDKKLHKKGATNYDIKKLALACSAKRMYPDWVSVKNNLEITGSSKPVTPMGCRSFLSMHKDQNGHEILDGRNNLGVVTVNPVHCALKALDAEDPEKEFLKNLAEIVEIAHKGLQARVASMVNATAEKSPVLYQNGAFGLRLPPEERVLPHLIARGCSISLGFIGLHETYNALFGNSTTDLKHRQDFYLQVTKYLRSQVDKWKAEEGVGYSLYATPSESLCHRLLKLDRKRFGVVEGVTDKEYYTNSFHLDVADKVDPFTKIDFEAPFHWISSGGHISYCEFPPMANNLEGLESVIDYAMDKLDYFGVNTPADKCLDCGAEVESKHTAKGYVCPICGSTNVNATRRICGYLGSINIRPTNPGKAQEFELRVKHC